MATGFIAFELDLMKAVMDQLVPSLDGLAGAPLSHANASALPDAQGVYLLISDVKMTVAVAESGTNPPCQK